MASSAASGTRRAAAMNVGRTASPHAPPVRLCSIRFAMPPSARPRKSSQAKRYELIALPPGGFEGKKRGLSLFLGGGSLQVLDARVLRELQGADVSDDRPAIFGRH